ncbi:histone-lysine N-methyltransferase SETMAR-like protein [Plakobranchus ocellatus]|uniref:Histone-lysine N-methyltransferase SETMAR-like protein n=1 Tax=Plakobranchus ocellatus TaxID=259542 RepID=A0AAV4BSZ2_9GAST|nr:histone-lysine N-methyltransferase SETMAR-like protein [Plakobranchus ocellatus]
MQLSLDRNHLDQVARLCVPYLSDSQPQALQQASLESFSQFVSLDADAMWLLLTYIYSPWCLETPGPEFVPVKLPTDAIKKNTFSSNISRIFQLHYSLEKLDTLKN